MSPNSANVERVLLDWLEAQGDAMVELLEELVNIDSGSRHKSGVDLVGARLRGFLDTHDLPCEILRHRRYGDAFRCGPTAGEGKPVILLGHRDTVFPRGEASRRPFFIKEGRAYGPGVADMKGGLVMNAFVLAGFAKFGSPVPVAALYTGDEEIGSPFSRPIIEEEARRARAVFNAEPGRPSGAVVTGRKGGMFMRLDVVGKAAHAGANFDQGISAIEEMARKIVALHALSDRDRGLTVNIGTVSGGLTVNTIAPHAFAEIDLRFIRPEDRDEAMREIRAIVAQASVPGTRATLDVGSEFFPLVESEAGMRLYRHYAACGHELGFEIANEFTGGCADSGFTAAVGAPTLCATGPVGGRAHTAEEYIDVLSLVPRAQTLALAVARLEAV